MLSSLYRLAIGIGILCSLVFVFLAFIAASTYGGKSYQSMLVLFICFSSLVAWGIPIILLEIMDDIKAMRKLQEEQAKKD